MDYQQNIMRAEYETKKREITAVVTHCLEDIIAKNTSGMDTTSLDFMNLLLHKRKDRAESNGRLRDMLVYLVMKVNGEELDENAIKTISAGEFFNIASYYQNWHLDDKNHVLELKNGGKNANIASHFYRELAYKTISDTTYSLEIKMKLLDGLSKSNYAIQKGQALELNELTFDKYFDTFVENPEKLEKTLIQKYIQRCYGFSGEFYGFSFAMGAMMSGAENHIIDRYHTMGRLFGTGLQMVNDVGDFFLEKNIANMVEKDYQDQFTDLEKGTFTLPLIQLSRNVPELKQYAGRKLFDEEKKVIFDKMLENQSFDLTRKISYTYNKLIIHELRKFDDSPEINQLKAAVNIIFRSNKFYSTLKKTYHYVFQDENIDNYVGMIK